MIDQDPPHRLRGDAEELGPVLPGERFRGSQPQEGFVDQQGRLQGMVGALAAHLALGDLVQLGLDQPDELLLDFGAPGLEIPQESSDLVGAGVVWRWIHG